MLLLNYLNKKWYLEFLKDKWQIKTDVLSWLTVALALIPEAVAFAFVAWVDPLIWLYGALIMSFITSAFWGRPGMISGATWALAVVMVSLVATHWIEYLFATIALMWILQITFWLFKLWKFVRLIPHPVMLGFVNGLAIVIFLAQLWQFKINWEWIVWSALLIMIWLVIATMLIVHFLPKLTKAIPSWLAAIIIVSLIVIFIPGIETRNVLDYIQAWWWTWISGWFPNFHIPNVLLNLETLYIILPYAFILASIWLIESLMTLSLIDEITETRWKANRESKAQWAWNILCWFFWWMWWCAMIWQSMINITNWWRWRLSWVSASLFLLIFILFWASLIEKIPLAALVWLMFMVVISTFAWTSIKLIWKIPRSDAFVLVFVTIITVFTDLAIAVISWVIISALVFAWKKSTQINVKRYIDEKNITHYELEWSVFFGSIKTFNSLFNHADDTKEIIIDFLNARVFDHSWIEAVNNLTEKYKSKGKILHLRHLSEDCRTLLDKAKDVIEVNIIKDPKYRVADDQLS